jgi:hypothetical protein
LSSQLAGYKGVDGPIDGLWTCRRGDQEFVFNSTSRPAETKVNGEAIQLAAHTIWCNEASAPKR